MPLQNALPANVGNRWSAVAPQQGLELITTWNLDERDALAIPPTPDFAWADIGTTVAQSIGIAKFGHALPQSLNFEPFKPGQARHYNTFDVVATEVPVSPFDLNFGIPMVWDEMGNGYKLMSPGPNNTLLEFVGIGGVGANYVMAGRAKKCMLVANLFYTSMYCTGSGITMTSPTQFTFPQPNGNPSGIALFTDGTGGEGTGGAQHHMNPTVASSGRFKNVYSAYGAFAANYGRSLTAMTTKPHALLPNTTSGARVTDTFGPTHMRNKFWEMMIQSLVMTTATVGGNGVAAGVTNPYALAQAMGVTEENFVGAAFGPRRFWIVPHLDNHPYVVANPTKDFWVNVSAGKDPKTGQQRPTWAKLASNSKEFVPTFRFYGPGDPRAQSERLMRFEGDLDGGARPGAPGEIDVFFEV